MTVCLAIFMCSRNSTNVNSNLMDVYRDRVPRWKTSPYPVYIIDSCNQTFGKPFTTPGMRTLSFAGSTSHSCSFSCPTLRETVALDFMLRYMNANCSFLFKITGKYWTPDLVPQIAAMPNGTRIVVQHDGYSSEIFGMERATFANFMNLYRNSKWNQEARLKRYVDMIRPNVFELHRMKLYNYTRRSDGRKLHWL